MLKEYNPKIVDKEVFARYYDSKDLEYIIRDMGKISVTFTELSAAKEFIENCQLHQKPTGEIFLMGIWDKAGPLLENLPLGEKASTYIKNLMKDLKYTRFKNEESIGKFFSGYQNILDDLTQGYRKILKERHNEL